MQKILVFLIRIYQKVISFHLRVRCKFYPSCSEYAIISINKYGFLKGCSKTVLRLIRCNPFSKGGVDFP
ncbi:MAG: membrane protein insertion efficiency factor YidD [Holosporaceae bacterium]|nr:membrane protein insertion efficiency factor YidD [Holosporaceae bacterium]